MLSVRRLSCQRAVCTGLDSSTTFLIVKCIRNFTKALEVSSMCNQELRQPIVDSTVCLSKSEHRAGWRAAIECLLQGT